jgi:hypothetical protein
MPRLDDFLAEIDALWVSEARKPISLRIIGSAALMLQSTYDRGTKDSDVLETEQLTKAIKERLLALAGQGSELHTRHKMYLEIVAGGLPFLPQRPRFHRLKSLDKRLEHFELEVLDIVDVVVSKLKPFRPQDLEDIRAMIELGKVEHRRLVERFRSAVDAFSMDARVGELPKYLRNLHRIERDLFLVGESEIELPQP